MIGLDTSLLVRVFVRDDAAMAARAEAAIRRRCSAAAPGFIDHIVLCELAGVLERAYDYRRDAVASLLDALCRASDFRVQDSGLVREALELFRAGQADFADCLIGLVNRAAGCATTITLDSKALALPGFESA